MSKERESKEEKSSASNTEVAPPRKLVEIIKTERGKEVARQCRILYEWDKDFEQEDPYSYPGYYDNGEPRKKEGKYLHPLTPRSSQLIQPKRVDEYNPHTFFRE